jgi:AcrR family transcriptional regulator
MTTTDAATRGRPQSSSREMLQEAAFELFLENGYAGTTVGQIANRAGVSRNTFFNYFAGKSDVFWIDLDSTLGQLREALRSAAVDQPALEAVQDALLTIADDLGPDRVPWALTQFSMIGDTQELQAAATSRLSSHIRVLTEFLAPRLLDSRAPMLARTAAYATVGACVAAAQAWASAGTGRGPLRPYLEAALTPVIEGFRSL